MTGPVMTKVVYEELIARANELEAPLVDQQGRGIPTEVPQPPCGLAIVKQGAKDLGYSADNMRYYLGLFDKSRKDLAQSLRNAAKAYRHVDEDAAAALRNETSLSGAAMSVPAPGDSGPAMFGAGVAPNQDVPEEAMDGLHNLEQAALELEQMDQGASFDRFAEQWAKYHDALLRARDRFRPFREWEGEAATAVGENFELQRTWLDTMARFSDQMSRQAQTIADEFRALRKQHVWGKDARYGKRVKWDYKSLLELEAWARANMHSGYETFMTTYNEASKNSLALLTDFRGKSGLPVSQVNPTTPPSAKKIDPPKPWKPSVRPSDEDIKKSHVLKPPPRPDWIPDDKPTPGPPTPSGDQGGLPFIPSTPMMPMMPSAAQTSEPQLAEALRDLKGQGAPKLPHDGGVKPASFGGAGVPGTPLQTWGEDGATARAAAAGAAAGPGMAGRGVPGAGAMGGGMGGAPAAGGDKGTGKAKRVQGDEEALYTEQRSWTEGVIGLRSAKEVPKQ
ncbi:hypothetical protein [Mycobacterium sp. pR1184]|uniref:PPE domain-containing protein n=1 Tax=Mycobacterium sp. pR1184 TaxID=3238981 RepID=UPI00351B5045